MSDNPNSEIQPSISDNICSHFINRGIDGASLLHIAFGKIVRQIVKKEIEQQLKYLNNGKCYSGAGSSSQSRNLELQFSCNVSETVWTAESIRGEGNSSILVTFSDPLTGEAVKSGSEASAKVEIVILKGSFERDDWTAEEFSQNIIKEMNGKNIFKGNAFLELKDGIGTLGNLSILHDQNWKPVSRLRLGARLVDSFQNIRVKEAKTQTFTMKDKRMKDHRKGVKQVSLMDNVGCLKHIGKCGPVVDRLTKEGIKTIKDFLNLYFVRPEDLRRILGHGWSGRKMNATIDHALKCKGSTALKGDARKLVEYAFDNKEEEGVVWDETLPPLVSPTTTTACASNGPFSCSSSPMMSEDVGAEAAVGIAFIREEERNASLFDPLFMINEHVPTTTTGGIISCSNNHWDAIDKNDPKNIFQVSDMIMDMNEFNWNNNSMLRVPSFSYEDDQLWSTMSFDGL